MAERVQALGDYPRELLAYRNDPDLATNDDEGRELVKALEATNLLIIDSLTRVPATAGVDEDRNREVAEFTRAFTDVIAQSIGTAVLILDNTGHAGERARGAVSKAALVEAVYKVSGGRTVGPEKHGTLTLELTRSRSGKLAEWVTAESGAGDYGPLTTQEGKAPATSTDANVERSRTSKRPCR